MEPTVTYAEFKVAENNVRECFDRLRQLAAAVKDAVGQLDQLTRLTGDLSRRLAGMEAREAAATGTPLKNRSGGDRMPPAFIEGA